MNQNIQLKIHPKMIVGLPGILVGGISIEDFSAVTKLNIADSKTILDEFIKNNIGTKQNRIVHYIQSNILIQWKKLLR